MTPTDSTMDPTAHPAQTAAQTPGQTPDSFDYDSQTVQEHPGGTVDTRAYQDADVQMHPDPSHALAAPPPAFTNGKGAGEGTGPASEVPARPKGRIPGIVWVVLLILAVVIVFAVVTGILSRSRAEHNLEKTTSVAAIPTVNVMHPLLTGNAGEISLPGNTVAFNDTPIYARTNGYVKAFYTDLGQHVRKGQLMATIETPEVDQQLQQAEADLKSTQANLNLANITAERYQNLLKEDSVSKQETDVATSTALARQAAVDASQANVRRLQQLQSFEHIYAPFDGVVTARNINPGDLINAGAGTAPKELFHVSSTKVLRVFSQVPEVYAPDIHDGDLAGLTLDEYPGVVFQGRITRNARSIDLNSRTLNVEVDVHNDDGRLLPGAYVFVHFKLPQSQHELSVPSTVLLFRAQGLQVGLVRDGRVHLQDVTISKDHGTTVTIGTGLTANDWIIQNPSDALSEGERVHVGNEKEAGAQ